MLKKVLFLPLKGVLPFIIFLSGAVNSHQLAQQYMKPYFKMKGIVSPLEQVGAQACALWNVPMSVPATICMSACRCCHEFASPTLIYCLCRRLWLLSTGFPSSNLVAQHWLSAVSL